MLLVQVTRCLFGGIFLKVPRSRSGGLYVTSLSKSVPVSRGLFLKVARFGGLFVYSVALLRA